MLDPKPVTSLVFADIETTSLYPSFKEMPERLQKIFKRRYKKFFEELLTKANPSDDKLFDQKVEEFYGTTAPLQPEWGRILCISIGTLSQEEANGPYKLKIVSYAHDDEKQLLTKFMNGTAKVSEGPSWNWKWVFHNGQSFDVPFIAKRIILNQLPLPSLWDFGHLKPWELNDRFIDTKVVWKMSVYDNSVSLDHLSALFDLESSKTTMDGSQVKDEYWINKNLVGIKDYCELDIKVLAEIYLKMKGIHNKVIVG